MTTLESSTTSNEQNKRKSKIKHPGIIEAIDGMDGEERFEYWLEPNTKQIGGGVAKHPKEMTAVERFNYWMSDLI